MQQYFLKNIDNFVNSIADLEFTFKIGKTKQKRCRKN